MLLQAWSFLCLSASADASEQVEHKWHNMCTSESWRTLVFLKAVIHFVGNDDDSGRKRGGGGWDLLVERAIKWPGIELHISRDGCWARGGSAVMKQVDRWKTLLSLRLKWSRLSGPFEAGSRCYFPAKWYCKIPFQIEKKHNCNRSITFHLSRHSD